MIRSQSSVSLAGVGVAYGTYAARALGMFPDGRDQLATMTAAVAKISSAGGGTIKFEPGAYVFSERFDLLDGVSLEGVKGKTIFDFSGRATWENSVENGLIRAFGSLGTPVALSQRAIRPQTKAFRLVGSRSGTTITFETDLDHGFEVGDPVWVEGSPATVAQAVFFTVNQAIGFTAKTTPFVVNTTPDSTHFTVEVEDTGDTTLSTFAYCYRAADTLILGDTSGFSPGDAVQIRSAAYRSDGASEMTHIGEFGEVARVPSATMLILQSSMQDDYLVSDTAEVVKVNFLEGISFKGIHLVGNGPNPGSGYGDRGLVMRFCRNPIVEDIRITDVDQMGVYAWSCLGGTVRNFDISFNASDESGITSGSLDIQYGVAHGGCDGLVIRDGLVVGGRHAVVESMTSSTSYFGVSRNITTDNVTGRGQWLSSFSSHQGIDNWTISNCFADGAETGVNPRFCRNVQIVNLNARVFKYGVHGYNVHENLIITGGVIEAGVYPIRIDQSDADYQTVKVNGVWTKGGEYGFYMLDARVGQTANNVEVINNTFEDCKYAGVRVSVGGVSEANDGWYGKINNNTIINVGQGADKYAIWLTNMRGGQVNNNNVLGVDQIAYLFRVTGVGTANFLEFYNNTYTPGLLSSEVFNCDAGYLHRTNMSPLSLTSSVTLLSGGLLTPRIAWPIVAMDTEGLAATDDLTDIVEGQLGMELSLYSVGGGLRVITVKDNTGTIECGSDFVWTSSRNVVILRWNGIAWCAAAADHN